MSYTQSTMLEDMAKTIKRLAERILVLEQRQTTASQRARLVEGRVKVIEKSSCSGFSMKATEFDRYLAKNSEQIG